MTIKLTFEFQTYEEASTFLGRHVTPSEAPKPKAAKKAAPVSLPSEPAKADSVPVAALAPAPVAAAPKMPNDPGQTLATMNEAAVRAALREVVNTKSMKVAADILKDFGAISISQIKPEQYAAFVKACKQ